MSEPLEHLRRNHPRFLYRGYDVLQGRDTVTLRFLLEIEPGIRFTPEVVFTGLDPARLAALPRAVLNNLAFHLGLMEIPSYWKAACSPEIVVEAGPLDEYQLRWWHDLLLRGQGEFFYNNGIDFTAPDFAAFRVEAAGAPRVAPHQGELDRGRVLVPVGGGKDSAVTMDMLARAGKAITSWALNPTPAMLDVIRAAGVGNQTREVSETFRVWAKPVLVRRSIDPELLRLNGAGYLNGHTPFSAYLAFLSVASAVLYGHGSVAVSNERSSNEGNALFLGHEVNHQYSKSFDFEARFRDYSTRYLAPGVDYFSFLRPLYELQIARLFARLPRYFPVFRSCNRGQKSNSWCLACPKCLFAFTILYPFLEDRDTDTIFTENLFEKPELVETAFELVGHREVKPFECVGAREESLVAFHLSVAKAAGPGGPLPPVLRAVQDQVLSRQEGMEARTEEVLRGWNDSNAVPAELAALLREELDRC